MAKYRSFKEFLIDNYSNTFRESLINFLIEDNFSFDDTLEEGHDDFIIERLNIEGIKFTKSEIDRVEFKVFISTKMTILYPDNEVKRDYGFVTKMGGSFKSEFKILDEIERVDEEFEENYTNKLVPVIKKEDYDHYATKFLKEYYPDALEKPTKLDISKLANRNGMTFYEAPLGNNILGVTYFADDVAEVYLEDGEIKDVDVHAGTILINADKAMERGEGALRNTFIHEAVHWFYHRNYFELQQLLDKERTYTACYRGYSNYGNEEIEWMEKQARALTPKILMPKKQATLKYQEILSLIKDVKVCSDIEKTKYLIKAFANFFGVSKESAKYRLIELGYTKASGINNYINKKKLSDFTFAKTSLKDHQTFVIDFESYNRLIETDETIRTAIYENKLIYTNGMIVANKTKYVIGGKLTEYALNHAHLCALIFDIYHDNDEALRSGNKTFYLLSSSSGRKINASVNKEQYEYILSKLDDSYEHYDSHKKDIPNDFGGALKYHKKKAKWTSEKLAFESDVNEHYVSDYINNKRKPSVLDIIKLGLAMKLSYPYIYDMVNKSDQDIQTRGSDNMILLATLANNTERLSLEEVYVMLKDIGRERLLNLSNNFLKNHGII